MGDLKFLITHYVLELWRRRWSILIVAWGVGLAGAYLAAKQPDVFASRATVFVDTRSLLRHFFKEDVFFENPSAQLENVRRLMYARPNIEKVISRTDLDLTVDDARQREALVERLEKELMLTRMGSDFYRIEYEHSTPRKAHDVVQAMLALFLEEGLGRGSGVNASEAERALRYALDQREEIAGRLAKAEAEMADFERANRDEISEPGAVMSTRRSLERDRLQVEGERTLYEQELRDLERQLASTPKQIQTGVYTPPAEVRIPELPPSRTKRPVPPDLPTAESQRAEALSAQALSIEREYQTLLDRLTPQHPDAIAFRRRVEAARAEADQARALAAGAEAAQRQRIQEALAYNAEVDEEYRRWQYRQSLPVAQPQPEPIFGENPLYSQLISQVAQRRSRLAVTEKRLDAIREQMTQTESVLQRQPEILQRYERLVKEIAGYKTELERVDGKIDTLRATDELSRQELVEFRIVEPPQVPVSPVGPNRLILFSGALFLALGAGGGIALLRVQFADNMPTIVHLRNAFALPVLGSVSKFERGAARTARTAIGHLVFLGAFGMLMLLFAFLIYRYHVLQWRPDLGGLVASASQRFGALL